MLGFLIFAYLCVNQYDFVDVSKGILPLDIHRPTIDEKYGVKIFNFSKEDAVFKISHVYVTDSWSNKYLAIKDKNIRVLCIKYKQTSKYSKKSWEIMKMVHLKSNRVFADDFSINVKWRCDNPAWALKWYHLDSLYK